MGDLKHISVCICTYKRPQLLKRLLQELAAQETNGLFTYSIVVADNDHLRSAESVVSDFTVASGIPIRYCVEPRQNIPLARNRAIENAEGDCIAFIDDDEFPIKQWLLTLFEACSKYDVDGVLGPVKPHFDEEAPAWIVKGRFYERPTYPTGFVIDWTNGRTGNVLFKRRIITREEQPFRPEFRSGEDQDFFRRKIEEGYVFIWCNEAVAYEVIPPARWKRTFMLRTALLRGEVTLNHPLSKAREIAKSIIALPAYTVALPFALALGQHKFMDLLIRLFHHMGKLLSLAGIQLTHRAYITE